MNEITIVESLKGTMAETKEFRGGYTINVPSGGKAQLRRGTDFGVIPNTKQPSLYKSGAEKVAAAYGLCQHYEVEQAIEDYGEQPFFLYRVKCELVKYGMTENGLTSAVMSIGYGSGNTREKRNGRNGAYDAANGTLKMAKKRALVDAAINLGGLSDLFSQDMENENFVEEGYKQMAQTANDDAPITPQQVKRLFAIAADNGMNAGQTKEVLKTLGFDSTKDLKQKDYVTVCEKLAAPVK